MNNKLNDERFYYLNEDYIVKTGDYLKLSGGQLDAVLKDLRAVISDDDLIETSLKWKDDIFKPGDIFKSPDADAWQIPAAAPLMPLIVLFSGLESLKRFYYENNIPDKVLLDTLFDINRNMDEIMARNGGFEIESWIFSWLIKHFTARLFHLGRLQFEAVRFDEDNTLLKNGDYVLNVHIPAGGKLAHDEIILSYKLAAEFFAELMPDIVFKGFMCESWMLSPQLKDILPSSSNLVQFLSDYKLFGTDSGDESFYTYIFVKKPEDLRALSEKTALQRAVKAHLLSGGKIEAGRGFIPVENV